MSVIMESSEGDGIYIISSFSASPYGEKFDFSTAHEFKIGENVKYLGEFKNKAATQDHLSWFIIFENQSGIKYASSQTYFVTEEEFKELRYFFQNE